MAKTNLFSSKRYEWGTRWYEAGTELKRAVRHGQLAGARIWNDSGTEEELFSSAFGLEAGSGAPHMP